MKIVPNRKIEIEYHNDVYSFWILAVEQSPSGFYVTLHIPDVFKKKFKHHENLSRWSYKRFEKFIVGALEKFLHEKN